MAAMTLPALVMAVATTLSLDHVTGIVTLDGKVVPEGETVAVPPGKPVGFTVTNTNSALYVASLTAVKEDAPQLAPLNSFLRALAPYVTDVPRTGIREASPLAEIDEAVFGEAGILKTHIRNEQALREMSRGPAEVAPAAARLKASLPKGWDTNVDRLLSAYSRLMPLQGPDSKETDRALQESGRLLEAARRVEAATRALIGATSEISLPPVTFAWNEGRKVTLRVGPTKVDPLVDFATLPPRVASVHLAPRWPVRVGLGASFLVSPGSTFEGPSGTQDARFTWGLTLSLAPRVLTPPMLAAKDWAVWLPELTLNPSTSDRSLALGAAIGWKILKLGAGALWTRHETPAGDQSYGSPQAYVSLSVTGWEPFKAE